MVVDPLSFKESSISVTVRVRPFTEAEQQNLVQEEPEELFFGDGALSTKSARSAATKHPSNTPYGIRKIINVVDDNMLIFDPPETNPVARMHRNAFPNSYINSRIREHRFVFDKLFDVEATQDQVYTATTKPLLTSVIDGFNATVFAYGATGCGKTHTITGTAEAPGVVFLTMQELYRMIDDLKDTKVIEVTLSFLEIYNETIKDLLRPETDHKKLVIREDSQNRISVSNLAAHKPSSVDEVMELIFLGNKNRTSSPTEANATSSRSHAVLQINVVQRNRTVDLTEEHTFATLSIIDLAGSERAAATKNTGARLNEGANINKSLLALGNCINALCDPRRKNHIPYRNSKLTRLLKFSLGGNCKTVMIVCVSPASQHYDETLNTLKYANRAKEIKTKVVRNQHNLDRHIGSYLRMITEQKQEIEELKTRESSVVECAVEKQIALSDKCLTEMMESIENLKGSIAKQSHDKWRKCYLLAKRKISLIQKVQLEAFLGGAQHQTDQLSELENIYSLGKQVVSKITKQIKDIEERYMKASEIDFILHDSSQHIHRMLRETESWLDIYSVVFESKLDSLRDSVQKDILFNSSILFDHLLHELPQTSLFVHAIDQYMREEDNGTARLNTGNSVLQALISELESQLNGDFDSLLEQKASQFMQKKIREHEYNEAVNPEAQPLQNTILVNKKRNKRDPHSALESPASRDTKRVGTDPISITTFQPLDINKINKKVHWEASHNSSVVESETSFGIEDSNILRSDVEEDSPMHNNILDKSDDDFNIKLDSNLVSPPLSRVFELNQNQRKGFKPRSRGSSMVHRKISNNENDILSKLPLLNKQASTRIFAPSQLSTPQSPGRSKIYSLQPASKIMNQYAAREDGRNVDSSSSNHVE